MVERSGGKGRKLWRLLIAKKTAVLSWTRRVTSYVIGIVDEEKFVGHAYYGPRLLEDDVNYLLKTGEAPLAQRFSA